MEHFTGAFSIASRDYWCMKIEESFIVKIFMNGKCHCMTDPQYCTESICPWTEISDLPQEFHRVTFLLKRVSLCITFTINFYGVSRNFHALSLPLGLYHFPGNRNAGACCYIF